MLPVMMAPVQRVIIAEDNALLRQGVVRLLERVDDIEVVGETSDLPSLRTVVDELDPDVVVTDIRMPPTRTDEGIQAAAWIAADHPGIGVVVLSQYVSPAYAVASRVAPAGAAICSRSVSVTSTTLRRRSGRWRRGGRCWILQLWMHSSRLPGRDPCRPSII